MLNQRDSLWVSLKAISQVLVAIGAPLPFVFLIGSYFHVDQSVQNVVALCIVIGSVILLIIARYSIQWRTFRKSAFANTLGWGLAALIGSVCIVLYITLSARTDRWVSWREDVLRDASACSETIAPANGRAISTDQTEVICLSDVLYADYPKRPAPSDAGRVSSQLADDLHVGDIIEAEPVFKPLRAAYGLSDTFLGTGAALPVRAESYNDARLPEFLMPNYPESHPGLSIWHFAADSIDTSLDKMFDSEIPDVINGVRNTTKGLLPDEIKHKIFMHLGLDDNTPTIIRFAFIPVGSYSNCIHRHGRLVAFGSHLGIALKLGLTIRQAAYESGYQYIQGPLPQEMYVFVYQPANEGDAMPPTWKTIASAAFNQLVHNGSPCP